MNPLLDLAAQVVLTLVVPGLGWWLLYDDDAPSRQEQFARRVRRRQRTPRQGGVRVENAPAKRLAASGFSRSR